MKKSDTITAKNLDDLLSKVKSSDDRPVIIWMEKKQWAEIKKALGIDR
jgi:hypothetical protein